MNDTTNTQSAQENKAEEAPASMAQRGEGRSRRPSSDAFRAFMGSGWGPRIQTEMKRSGAADYLPERAEAAGEPFKGERLVIPAGTYKVRSNDCDTASAHTPLSHTFRASVASANLILSSFLNRAKTAHTSRFCTSARALHVLPRSSTPTQPTASSGWAPAPLWKRLAPRPDSAASTSIRSATLCRRTLG